MTDPSPKRHLRQPCLDCRHFQISHDASFPYACKVMQFKSRNLPCIDVQKHSGQRCQWFAVKPQRS